ncbi:hypothetical protein MPTK1_8g05560 [Marchantia polymorpha subsp. ruderalis]|uniref:Uncharacterized protein n=1 Tax=Marchantia polymorpha TaxID=3197 RepID=A0A2R6WKG2_MARPO|nr:hypothetical protein MARPO_0081s0057 [Marchantia polymorpha]BBN18794.1 hypothetical protein Mp_8g05560 [Marchantia polymorpha subsp. ruderalis]|eukprot:PTQ34332.1 hypothetical protein MARPO_0081s0057 [Marchantia polymorpha]
MMGLNYDVTSIMSPLILLLCLAPASALCFSELCMHLFTSHPIRSHSDLDELLLRSVNTFDRRHYIHHPTRETYKMIFDRYNIRYRQLLM